MKGNIRQLIRTAPALFLEWVGGTTSLRKGVTVGRHTYGHRWSTFMVDPNSNRISIGDYCSIAPGVKILAGSDRRRLEDVSTYPVRTLLLKGNEPWISSGQHPSLPGPEPDHDAKTKGETRIGNDVWLGLESVILSGVNVGDGAVVGAKAVVASDVPPYAIVVGHPARIVRYRFSPEQIQGLQKIAWWNWSEQKIRECESDFYGDIEEFLRKHAIR